MKIELKRDTPTLFQNKKTSDNSKQCSDSGRTVLDCRLARSTLLKTYDYQRKCKLLSHVQNSAGLQYDGTCAKGLEEATGCCHPEACICRLWQQGEASPRGSALLSNYVLRYFASPASILFPPPAYYPLLRTFN